MGGELDWDDDVDLSKSMLRTVAEASPFPDAWESGGLDYDDIGETEVSAIAPLERHDPNTLQVGTLVAGRYCIEGVIGRGAMGVVYEASHVGMGQPVALKFLHPSVAASTASVRRFFREAQIAALVQHPNIVRIFDGGRHDQTHFLVMERLHGRTLTQMLEGKPSIDEIVGIFVEILDGVAAVHERGVVHRDLKPDNVFLTDDPSAGPLGRPKVLDFGASKLYQAETDGKLTMAGMVMGTPHYMAPEQFTDTSAVDAQADVYSLGVMLYEALAGKVPYDGEGVIGIYRQASEGKAPSLREARPEISPELDELVRRAMHPELAYRFASARAMRATLESVPTRASDALWAPLPVAPTQMMAQPVTGDHPAMVARPAGPAPQPAPRSASSSSPTSSSPTSSSSGRMLFVAIGVGAGVALVSVAAAVLYALLFL